MSSRFPTSDWSVINFFQSILSECDNIFRKKLFTDRVSVNKKYLTDSVSVNKKYLTDSGVPIEKSQDCA